VQLDTVMKQTNARQSACNGTNLMLCLSSVHSVTIYIYLHVSLHAYIEKRCQHNIKLSIISIPDDVSAILVAIHRKVFQKPDIKYKVFTIHGFFNAFLEYKKEINVLSDN
jgi:hypothetical protein